MGGLGTPGAPLIGRDAELTAVTGMLGNGVRMLTLTGPPGVGKTRLAAAAADSLASTFAHGAAFADLSLVREPQRAMSEVARCVGLGSGGPGERVLERLHQWLGARHLLLVVDNVEQVPGIGPALADLLTDCPRLHLLVTGRENLHLRLEHEYPVPPLAMPQPDEYDDLERLHANAAVSLFELRARAVRPDFTVSSHNAAAVAEICVRLDGLPLALELAAARTKLLTPAEICTRLRQRLVLLDAGARDVPARHRTLRAAISWSHDLLDDAERALLRRLSVFVGGWTLAAAEQVCADAGTDVLEVVGSLVDKSLLYRVGAAAGESELGMLESIREYAAEQLRAHGEADRTADRHAAYFTALGVEAEAGIGTHDETFWWNWIGRQEGNLRAVLERCLARGDISSALSVATTMGWYWYTRGYLGEGQATLDEVLELADAVDAPSAQPPAATLAGANMVAGILSWSRGDGVRAGLLLSRALDRSVAAGDIRRTAIASAFLGHVARERGDFDEAAQRHELAGRLSDEMGNVRGSAWARYDLGRLALQRGDLDTAGALLRESLMRFRDIGYPWAVAWSSWALGT
ncbi:MAG: AAA family ATPase, partial [Propionibacteriales bacterium]|nr:AAA family ATPase [Propionibacteriales bacterium]